MTGASSNPCMQLRHQPNGLVIVLLPLLHFASVKLSFMMALSPENEVVVWLPNAVLLAALLHYRGQRAWLFASLTLASDVLANLPMFPALHALLLSLCNLGEVVVTYLLMRRLGASAGLQQIQDFGKFVIAGPFFGALVGAVLAAAVLRTLDGVHTAYETLLLLWWFGDGLGLLIYTPLLLGFLQPVREPYRVSPFDALVLVATLALAVLIFSGQGERFDGIVLTPNLLFPFVLFIAVRFGTRWTALSVALIALAAAWSQTTGLKPFGITSAHGMILRTQEFILTLSIIGMGFAILLSEQRAHARELEDKVRARTRELEASNSKLAALSAIDGLTGIGNRRQFDEVLLREWERCQRSGQVLALALLDVDLFKAYNDYYGHQAGDDCLRMVANELTEGVRRASDFVARYGGEEFAIIAPAADALSASALAQNICVALRNKTREHAHSPFGVVTASIGVAVVTPTAGDTPEHLIKRADQALYQAKERGRNQIVLAPASGASVPVSA